MQQQATAVPVQQCALVDVSTLLSTVPVSRVTIWRWIKAGQFPKPVRVINGRNYWAEDDIRQWLNAKD